MAAHLFISLSNTSNNKIRQPRKTWDIFGVLAIHLRAKPRSFPRDVGNCDAHGKNFSLLYLNQLQLAPLYDLICTIYYQDLSRKMAMKLGGEYQIDKINAENFNSLATEIGFAKPEVRRRIRELIEAILASLPMIERHHRVQEEIADLIRVRCENFLKKYLK